MLNRETWISLLDAALQRPGDELNEEWRWLLEQLGMNSEDYPAILKALQQGRWRKADDPKAYLAYVARKEARRDQLDAEKRDNLVLMPTTAEGRSASPEGTLDHVAYVRDATEAVLGSDGIWRSGGGADRDYYSYEEDDDGDPVESYREHLLAKVPGTLKQKKPPSKEWVRTLRWLNKQTESFQHAKPSVQVDWKGWAKQAGLDGWETKVLQYRASGVSRDEALAKQSDEASRKALQAAWRKFDRSSKQTLKDFAQKNLKRNVPE